MWIYGHLPLAIGLTAGGIGLEFLVAQEGEKVRWVAVGGIALALLAMGVIHLATERSDAPRGIVQAQARLLAASAVLVLGLMSESWAPNILLIALAVVIAAQVLVDQLVADS